VASLDPEEAGARALLARAYSFLLVAFVAIGLPFAIRYRSEGAGDGRYTSRYLYGVLFPLAALSALALVLLIAPRLSSALLRSTLGRAPRPAAGVAAAVLLLGAALYAFTISDEYVSVLMLLLVPCAAALAWEKSFARSEALLVAAPLLVVGLALFAVELPGFLRGGPLLVWGDDSTFATLFPRTPPYIGSGGRLRPNLHGRMRAPEYRSGALLVTNSEGFRNAEEFRGGPAPGTTRVLSLGDSFSTGFGADQEAFFGSLLEKEMRAGGGRVSVMNAEVSDPAYGLLYLQEFGLARRPGVVLYGLSGNDIMQSEEFEGPDRLFVLGDGRRLRSNPAFDPSIGSAWDRFHDFACPRAGVPGSDPSPLPARILAKLVRFQLFAGIASYAARAGGAPVDMPGYASAWEKADGRKRLVDGSANLAFFYRAGGEPVERMYAAFLDLLVAMDGAAREGGARFVLVLYPERYQVQPRDWEAIRKRWRLDEADFDLDLENRRIGAFCAERGIEVCDLVEPFREAARDRNLYLPAGDMHFNRFGHEVAASAVRRCLAAKESSR